MVYNEAIGPTIPQDPITRFEDFFRYFERPTGNFVYLEKIKLIDKLGDTRSLQVDHEHLMSYDPQLAADLHDDPNEYLEKANQALVNILHQVSGGRIKLTDKYFVRFRNLHHSYKVGLRMIRAEHMEKLISVSGSLIRTSTVHPQLVSATFECKICHAIHSDIPQLDDRITYPTMCGIGGCKNSKASGFRLLSNKSKFVDWQQIRIQESPEELTSGNVPRFLDCLLKHDLVDTCRPGNRVTVVGVIKVFPGSKRGGSKDRVFHQIMHVNNIYSEDKEDESLEITPEDKEEIIRYSQDPFIHEKIVRSLSPAIFGYDEIKLAMALVLFGGVPKIKKSGHRIRGDIHVLIMGDPGTGKSQLIKSIEQIYPRGIYTSGQGSTAAGLCVAGDSKIILDRGLTRIADFVESQFLSGMPRNYNEKIEYLDYDGGNLVLISENLKAVHQQIDRVWRIKSPDNLIKITSISGREIKLTSQTPFLTFSDDLGVAWIQSSLLQPGDLVAIAPDFPLAGRDAEPSGPDLCASKMDWHVVWEQVKKIDVIQSDDSFVYDLTVRGTHNFIVNGFVVHNTAAVLREETTGGMVLEAGALVLADGGVAAIDEFDKMRDVDRVAIHEVMEQQTVSIAKAGIVATLNARTSIIAAANPKNGRWDPDLSLRDNINLPPSILSRFDLLFLLKDKPKVDRDAMIADHIIKLHMPEDKLGPEVEEIEAPIPIPVLRKYIKYAENIKPELTMEAADKIKEFYLEMRKPAQGNEDSPIPIVARTLEGIIRMSEAHAKMALRNQVLVEDVEAVIKLKKYSMKQVNWDEERQAFDADTIQLGRPWPKIKKLNRILDFIKHAQEENNNKPIPINDVIQRASFDNIGEDEVRKLVEILEKEGQISVNHVKEDGDDVLYLFSLSR
ncbi:MAG: ATP-binding protein [Promethearchaeota archaeon]